MKVAIKCISLLMVMTMLSGCLYPNDQRAENQIAYPDQLNSVQQAVNQFQQDHGVLPIKTRDMNTPIYQKYPVDFRQLVPRYLQQAPGNSFENGGVFQYVLINVEEAPEVKLVDLAVMREVQDFQTRLNNYIRRHQFPPVDEMVDVGLFTIDYKELNYDEYPRVRTRYFENSVPLLLDNKGNILIDYKIDLNMALLQKENHSFENGDDIRSILVEDSPFVPVFSFPYTINEAGEPEYMFFLP
ncbi:hypothetical protein [Bacillus sp. FJAT-45350]|uniref:hypothetical protein n=1 Tax=Bacillus sp. FJAT-45350 TaxID=2011014 RepID=UPI000BB8CDA2|nr:hypothetical protein [Bacillus sp. FJAT-45350]